MNCLPSFLTYYRYLSSFYPSHFTTSFSPYEVSPVLPPVQTYFLTYSLPSFHPNKLPSLLFPYKRPSLHLYKLLPIFTNFLPAFHTSFLLPFVLSFRPYKFPPIQTPFLRYNLPSFLQSSFRYSTTLSRTGREMRGPCKMSMK